MLKVCFVPGLFVTKDVLKFWIFHKPGRFVAGCFDTINVLWL
jgi:hypothetical protein